MKIEIVWTKESIVPPARETDEPETGAVVEFHGRVRATENAALIHGLFYEAYRPMAENKLREILEELSRKFPAQSVGFTHRLGWVPVGETSLYVRVAAQHRGEAFALCAELIHRLKQDVPVWKSMVDRRVIDATTSAVLP